jgi:hypothetical protein
MPSVLAEVSFLVAPSRTPPFTSYRQQIAEALFAGVMKYQNSLKACSSAFWVWSFVLRSSAAGPACRWVVGAVAQAANGDESRRDEPPSAAAAARRRPSGTCRDDIDADVARGFRLLEDFNDDRGLL